MQNQLPTPRSIVSLIEEKTNFIVNIGDGDNIGGEIEGFDTNDQPIYIDYHDDGNYYHVNYNTLTSDEFLKLMIESSASLEQMNSAYWVKDCYSVEELIETLNSFTK